ncbi:IS701 family transposase [Amycolatopsis cynarae]|uniref:IS701 family transposase n=1 Tax=Amycolatopsis cynarae TaxID=2995223 RepID=A0ABY7BA08_9PSEU|nr:IS701 family transposase [Amycolatopsis sp. HUAS 11-8]WAL67696.1 IS701 family transposase [Amycolatopsis sp. HUAS 11-8]
MFDELTGRIAGRFSRVEPRRRAEKLLLGLVSGLPRKNCWTIAEYVGDATPDGLQHLLARAVWDAEAVRDDLRDYVCEHLGDRDAVLIVDETGDLKKGTRTVGVQRQYTGTAGRIENSQVAVYLTYATTAGHALIDRALYLPKSWTGDRDRCAAAGVPAEVGFATKPALASTMISRALDAGVPAPWVTGDEVYGADPRLRAELEGRGVGYVLAIGCDRRVTTGVGPLRADEVAARLPRHVWQRLSAGAGAKGHRFYDWALADIDPGADVAGHRWLLIRRNRRTKELAFYRYYAPDLVALPVLVRVAGTRWRVEESFQTGKGLAGLDQHQVRRWTSWHRWTILAMLAHAFLTIVAATERARETASPGWIPLTCNEVQHLFATIAITPTTNTAHRIRFSHWRRHHQNRARQAHYQRQSTREP